MSQKPQISIDEQEHMPIFPLRTVLFPGGVLPLRIFEPRYVDMVRWCMREQANFGVVLLREGGEVIDGADALMQTKNSSRSALKRKLSISIRRTMAYWVSLPRGAENSRCWM